MALQYDINSIFAELKQKIRNNELPIQELLEGTKDTIESPEDAPETEEVAPATSKTTEDKHGGDEVSKEVKNSPNSADDGINLKNEDKHNQEYLKEQIEQLFYEKEAEKFNFMVYNQEEYLKKYILEIVKKIASKHAGIDKQEGSESYDKKEILKHMLKHQEYKILGDKYDLKDARYVQFFIDTSGVYKSGSNRMLQELMPKVISVLEKQGYECYIAACGNGFYQKDMIEDECYGTRKTLEGYKTGKVSEIACPTPETAAKMANEAEFSIILADFDGLSSICRMANLCQKDKVPYFLCTEDRYPWEDPTLHDWVDPDFCDYNPELVYDVSIEGNPTLEQCENGRYEEEYEY